MKRAYFQTKSVAFNFAANIPYPVVVGRHHSADGWTVVWDTRENRLQVDWTL